MPHFTKPAEGSWTEHYPELGTGAGHLPATRSRPSSTSSSARRSSRRTWLNVGRVEQLPKVGSYFTRELDAARHVDRRRARHPTARSAPSTTSAGTAATSSCGPTTPREETSGSCRQFTCKYHGWRYALDGQCTFVQQESEFFDLDKSDYGLAAVQADVWEGFIFVNLDPATRRRCASTSGELGKGLEGYPFHELTQVHKYRAEVGSNWKLFIDAFAEFYHAPILHAKQSVAEESQKLVERGYEALAYGIDGPHGMVSSWGGMAPPKDLNMVKPIERVLRSGLFGPWDAPDIGLDELPPGLNPARQQGVGPRLVRLLPQLHGADLEAELGPHVPLLADVLQHPHLRGDLLLRAAEERASSGSHRSSRSSRSRSTRSRTATRSRRRSRCSSRARR